MTIKNRSIGTWVVSLVAIIFGFMTLRSGGTTLFVPEVRAATGNAVYFVLWINFILGFAYIAAGVGLFLGKAWGKNLSLAIASITLLSYAAFGIHIAMGGLFMAKTVKAMAIRSLVWVSIAFYAVKTGTHKIQNQED